jgi:hypothetical protein
MRLEEPFIYRRVYCENEEARRGCYFREYYTVYGQKFTIPDSQSFDPNKTVQFRPIMKIAYNPSKPRNMVTREFDIDYYFADTGNKAVLPSMKNVIDVRLKNGTTIPMQVLNLEDVKARKAQYYLVQSVYPINNEAFYPDDFRSYNNSRPDQQCVRFIQNLSSNESIQLCVNKMDLLNNCKIVSVDIPTIDQLNNIQK